MKKINLIVVCILLFASCEYFTVKQEEEKAVARVHESYLYESDLMKILNKNISKQDSILLINNYINNWVKQQLLLDKAEINLADEVEDFEKLVAKYKEDLFINSYKEAVVKEYLNTDITQQDIDEFYLKNTKNFRLNEELLKLKYIKFAKNIPNKKELIDLFKSSKKKDLDSLQTQELSLISHHLNDSIWIKYSDLMAKVSVLKDVAKKQLLKKENFIQKEDSISLYLVTLKQVLNRNDLAPKSYITPTIRQMILHQRRLLLLRNIEETLIEDAQKKEQFEIY